MFERGGNQTINKPIQNYTPIKSAYEWRNTCYMEVYLRITCDGKVFLITYKVEFYWILILMKIFNDRLIEHR